METWALELGFTGMIFISGQPKEIVAFISLKTIWMEKIIGIDISKVTLDMYVYDTQNYYQLENTESVIKDFLRWFIDYTVFYESTGVYGSKLMKACNEWKMTHFMIENQLMQRMWQSLWDRNKTDKIDAQQIAEVGKLLLDISQRKNMKQKIILPNSEIINQLNSMLSCVKSLRQQIIKMKQLIDKLKNDIYSPNGMQEFYEKQMKQYEEKISEVYNEIEQQLWGLWYKKRLENLCTIPWINKKVWIDILILFMNLEAKGFHPKDTSKLKAYIGIDPIKTQSWTSINKCKISKKGNKFVRQSLYLSWICRYSLMKFEKYKNTDLWKFFLRMQNNFSSDTKKCWKKVATAMTKKLILTAWWIFRSNLAYDRR